MSLQSGIAGITCSQATSKLSFWAHTLVLLRDPTKSNLRIRALALLRDTNKKPSPWTRTWCSSTPSKTNLRDRTLELLQDSIKLGSLGPHLALFSTHPMLSPWYRTLILPRGSSRVSPSTLHLGVLLIFTKKQAKH